MTKSAFIQDKITSIQDRLAKPVSEFQTGGFRPTGERTEHWIGRVFLCKPDEAKPITDADGKPLYPLAQFYLPDLPFVPEKLRHVTWLTVFMGEDFPEVYSELGKNGTGWLIREYTADDELVHYEYQQQGFPKPFPLKATFKPQDFPLWDGGGMSYEMAKEIHQFDNFDDKDNPDKLNYYDDIVGGNHSYAHKFGGYPSFCQSGVDFGDGFEFMFQISSDAKACFNVVDNGSLMFARNDEGEWVLYYDFY